MDNMSILFSKQFTNRVERILHSPGSIPGKMFEMAVVVDESLSLSDVQNFIPKLLGILKRHSDVFLNVRLNVVKWNGDDDIKNEVVPMSIAMISSYYNEYEQNKKTKTYEILMNYLKLFQARAKLIIIVTDGKYKTEDEEKLNKIMQPFLNRKVMEVIVSDGDIKVKYQ